jgi:glycosyltransferase involved in cell wall biosynthesis
MYNQTNKVPRVSVLMAVYNGSRHLVEAIESVLSQSLQDFELIMINDGSKDNSHDIIQKYLANDSRCVYITRSNKGLVETKNELILRARAEYIAWLDQDDVCFPTRLEKLVEYLDNHQECVAVGSEALLIDDVGYPICKFFLSKSHDEIDQSNLSGDGSHICNPSVALRKSVVLELGGIRKDFVYSEDIDLFLRMAEIGRLAILPEVLVKYRQHLNAAGYSLRAEQIVSSQRAINEARTRRGLPLLTADDLAKQQKYTSEAEIFSKWAWWALSDKNYRTSFKYGWAALIHKPLKAEPWKIIICTFRDMIKKNLCRRK